MSNPLVSFDEEAVRDELRELVRKTIEETINAMYLAGVSTRRIEDVSEILWGAGVSAGTVSNLNEKSPKSANERWRRPPTREYPYVYVNGIYPKRSRDGSYKNVAVMVAVGVNEDGYREAIESPSRPSVVTASCRGRSREGCAASGCSPATRRIARPRFRATPRTATWRRTTPHIPDAPPSPCSRSGASTHATQQSQCLRPAPTGTETRVRHAILNARKPHLQTSGRFRRPNQPETPPSADVSPGRRSRRRTTPPKTAQKPRTHGEIGARFLQNCPEPAGDAPAGEAAAAISADANATPDIAADAPPSPVQKRFERRRHPQPLCRPLPHGTHLCSF